MSDENQQPGFAQDRQSDGPQYQPQPQYAPPEYQQPQPQYAPPEYQQPQPQPMPPPPSYQPPQQYNYGDNRWPPMTIGNWLVTMLLLLIPIVNFVLILVWAFGSNVNPSKKTYFQAHLIFVVIGVVLSIALWSTIIAMFSTLLYNLPF